MICINRHVESANDIGYDDTTLAGVRRAAEPIHFASLDKSIDGIQFLLGAADVPVSLAPTDMPGEPIESVDGEIHFGLDAALVKQFAENLRANTFDVLGGAL